ncbi:MAG: alpha/beta hydrolase [Desulfobulbaceae bacterium]|nr:alpha/beta hydrolase [Desulfobulbaceae bacterium]
MNRGTESAFNPSAPLTAGILCTVFLIIVYTVLYPISNFIIGYLSWKATAAAVPETGYVRRQHGNIHYVVYGKGAPLVLLHGGLSNKLCWFSQLPMLVRSERRVILLDTRGHGKSTPGNIEPSYQLYAQDVVGVLDHLHIGSADVLGWSDGGNTALMLAYRYSKRIRSILLISANFNPEGLTSEIRRDNRKPYGRFRQWFNRFWTRSDREYPQLERQVKKLWETSPRMTSAMLAAITCPVLIIVGEHDYVSVAHAREMTEAVANGKLTVIAGGGHSTPITHAAEINRLIRRFLINPEGSSRKIPTGSISSAQTK